MIHDSHQKVRFHVETYQAMCLLENIHITVFLWKLCAIYCDQNGKLERVWKAKMV